MVKETADGLDKQKRFLNLKVSFASMDANSISSSYWIRFSIGLSASTPAIARPEAARNQTGLAGGESRLP